jgi:hypothetical protein
MQHQYFNDQQFYLDKKTGYWISSIAHPRKRMHVVVWEFNNGKVLKGFHVHHIDGNKSNNSIENLKLLSKSEHLSLHAKNLSPDRLAKNKEHMETIRPLTKKWHASDEGYEWHSKHALETFTRKNPIEAKCLCCGKIFKTDSNDLHHSKFCTNACKSRQRRTMKIDDIEMTCDFCGKNFKRNKYAKGKCFCSISCGRKSYWSKNKKHHKD